MRLENFFSKQNSNSTETIVEDGKVYIQFSIDHSWFAVAIEYIREIIESREITPYPKKQKGHLGIISLRGRIIPVIEFGESGTKSSSRRNEEFKFLILEFQENQSFCLRVQKARRVIIDDTTLKESIVNIENLPVQVLTESDFCEAQEVAAS